MEGHKSNSTKVSSFSHIQQAIEHSPDGNVSVLLQISEESQDEAIDSNTSETVNSKTSFKSSVSKADQIKNIVDKNLSSLKSKVSSEAFFYEYKNLSMVSTLIDQTTLSELIDAGLIKSAQLDSKKYLNLSSSLQNINANKVQSLGYGGKNYSVAVIDTGVQQGHPGLGNRLVAGACFSPDCGNSTESQLGISAGTPCTSGSSCYHGTHVAGIVAANHSQFKGVAPESNIVSLKVFPPDGESTSDRHIVKALDYVLEIADTYKIVVVNMSLGGGAYASITQCSLENPAYLDAFKKLRAKGIAIVVASGNEELNHEIAAPACVPGAVRVGSSTNSNTVSSFSNQVAWLHFMAPGSSILSLNTGSGTRVASGTSMAAPHIAGSIALLKSASPSADVDQILGAMLLSSSRISDARTGASIAKPNLEKALQYLRNKMWTYSFDDEDLMTQKFQLINTGLLKASNNMSHGGTYRNVSASVKVNLQFLDSEKADYQWIFYHPVAKANTVLEVKYTSGSYTQSKSITLNSLGKTALGIFSHMGSISSIEISSASAFTLDRIDLVKQVSLKESISRNTFSERSSNQLEVLYATLGGQATFKAGDPDMASGNFTWYKASNVYASANSASLVIPVVTASDAGFYSLSAQFPSSAVPERSDSVELKVVDTTKQTLIQFETEASLGSVLKVYYKNKLIYQKEIIFKEQYHNIIVDELNIDMDDLKMVVE